MILLNRFAGVLSGLSGVGMVVYSFPAHDLATFFSGFGATTVAVILFQMADMRERMTRIEGILLNQNAKGKSAR